MEDTEDVLPPIRLLLFGDSWVRDGDMTTWPEQIGDMLGWPTVNVALPGSHSGTLPLQYSLLQRMLSHQRRGIHSDAWALVHAGGNDILHSRPEKLVALVGKMLCCGTCLPCVSELGSLDAALANVRELCLRLRDDYGVQNVAFCGLPLTMRLPVVSQFLSLLLGTSPTVMCLGGVAVRNINWLYLRRLQGLGDELGLRVAVLDEANAIDEVLADAATTGISTDARGGSLSSRRLDADDEDASGASELDEAGREGSDEGGAIGHGGPHKGRAGAPREPLLRGRNPDDFWADPLHPSQHLHTALSKTLLERFLLQRGGERGESSRPSAARPDRVDRARIHVLGRGHTGADADGPV